MKPDASYDDSRAEEALATADREHRRKPAAKHGTSHASTLPFWEVQPSTAARRAPLNIICPRCGGQAVVSRKWLTSRPGFIGRSCTYCFKVNRLPEE